MKSLLIWVFTALLFTAVGGLCTWTWLKHHEEKEPGEKENHPAASAPADEGGKEKKEKKERLSHDEAGNVVVAFDKESQERMGIEVKPLAAVTHHPEAIAYGTLQEDPARSFTLRAPLAGTLRVAPNRQWPILGATLPDHALIGLIQPRLGAVELADLSARLATARADVQSARASLQALQASLESKEKLHREGGIVSTQALEDARAQVAGEKAKLEAAQKTVQILEGFTANATQPASTESLPLVVSKGGRVMEIMAQPGEAIESGQPVLRVAQLDHLLARISLPAGESLAAKVTKAHVIVPGHETTPLKATQIGAAPSADNLTGGQTFLFAVEAADFLLQPGMAITAHLELPGEPRQGVTVPRSAIVRFGGSTWVYIRSAEEKFTRRPAPLDISTAEGWFVAETLKPGDPVVVRGAQSVLSEELKFSSSEQEE